MFDRFLANQLSCPTGFWGRLILGRLWNRRNLALNETAFRLLELEGNERVLEVGFGGGYLLGRLLAATPQGQIAGIDVSEAMVANCRRQFQVAILQDRLSLTCASAEKLPFPDRSFTKVTKVCTVNSIFYWANPQAVLREIARVLAAKGTLVLVLTEKTSLKKKGFAEHGLKLFTVDDIEEMLTVAGFQSMRIFREMDAHRAFLGIVASVDQSKYSAAGSSFIGRGN